MSISPTARTARLGMYRVIAVDTFDGTDWVAKDCASLAEAQMYAREETAGKQMLKMHIYDDQGGHCGDEGTF